VAELDPKNIKSLPRVSLTVRACVIRDGTQGISLCIGEDVIGEWTDSRATTLSLTDDLKVSIRGPNGNHLYMFGVPGKNLSGDQASETEVTVTFELE
jgi:hypothetical protein